MAILTTLSSDNFKVIAGYLGEANSFTEASKGCKQRAEESFYPVIFKAIVAEPALAECIPDNIQSLPNDAARVRAIYKRFILRMNEHGYAFIDPRRVSLDVRSLVRLLSLPMMPLFDDIELPPDKMGMRLGQKPKFDWLRTENGMRRATMEERFRLVNVLVLEKSLEEIKKVKLDTFDISRFANIKSLEISLILKEPSCWEQMLDSFCSFWICIWQAITSLFKSS